ncbi:hypothetical protein CS062_16200 [Roseateles chitinivorans]|uniref:Uncharacterized protein n=1 Tax=Roseateles chitinivorans TaxID=2917965 RepID=A0A2G9C6W5_9BURK|nr:hypothetical protein [Roseateles chitinivorans]PIM52095.1 hypothetical protein CS062_16200 [Roseateles chitinivorans]
MAQWSYFLPDLLPHVTGAAEPTIARALRLAAQDFFKRTRAWRPWLPEIVTIAGQRTYALTLPAGAVVERLERATLNGSPIDVLNFNCFEADPELHPSLDAGVASRDRVNVLTATDYGAGAKLQFQASLKPGDTATGIADDMAIQFRDALVSGAKKRLLLNPKADYFSPELASIAAGEYEAAIGATQAQVFRNFTNATPRQRPQWC